MEDSYIPVFESCLLPKIPVINNFNDNYMKVFIGSLLCGYKWQMLEVGYDNPVRKPTQFLYGKLFYYYCPIVFISIVVLRIGIVFFGVIRVLFPFRIH